jgi:hypothetical protein
MKVVGSNPNEVNEFFSIFLILLATLGQKHTNNVSGEYGTAGA